MSEELRALGYEFRGGRLLQVSSDKGFEFKDQQHYDQLADAVLRYVGYCLVEEAKLQPVLLPLGAAAGPRCPVFCSPGLESAQKVLLMIQGSGRVRVGVWGCALCINKDLDHGTMLPYLQLAAEKGYGVVVLNPNENEVEGVPIPGSETCDNHVAYVWEHIVTARCAPTAVVDVVAHSNGGRALLDFLARAAVAGAGQPVAASAAERIRRVVFTDSYHSPDQVAALAPASRAMLADRGRVVNFVPHPAPFGTPVAEWVTLRYRMTQEQKGCACVSAAIEDHAATNHASLLAAFDFFSS